MDEKRVFWLFDPEDPRCGVCGEPLLEEHGEFTEPEGFGSIIADAQCGIDAGLEMA